MSYPISKCSPQAAFKLIDDCEHEPPTVSTSPLIKYPFHALHFGYSFAVPIGTVPETSLRQTSSNKSRVSTKQFTVIKHEHLGLLEVARIR